MGLGALITQKATENPYIPLAVLGRFSDSLSTYINMQNPKVREIGTMKPFIDEFGLTPGIATHELVLYGLYFGSMACLNRAEPIKNMKLGNKGLLASATFSACAVANNILCANGYPVFRDLKTYFQDIQYFIQLLT
tara:strand:+ start:3674 stop:4081 length:408 start_codon:yes stop_codon:yes gene_type:complete